MILSTVRSPLALFLPAAAAALATLTLQHGSTTTTLIGAVAVLTTAALVAWPWAAVPLAVLGGALASQILGLDRVGPIVAVHLSLVALGFLAVLVRRGVDPPWGRRMTTAADLPMLAFAGAIVLGSVYGLAANHQQHAVLVGAYELGVIPLYFFLSTLTLGSRARLTAACVLFGAGAAAFALAGLAHGGRHGGLFSALSLPVALAYASTTRRRAMRTLALAAAALCAIDVVLSGYRTIWLAAAIAVALQLASGSSRLRRGAAAAFGIAVTVAAGAAAAGAGGFAARASLAAAELHDSAGYRVAEAHVGWHAFLAEPLFGRGVGFVADARYIPSFGVVNVGPVYHVFYVTVLVNGGILLLALLLWPLVTAIRAGFTRSEGGAAVCALLVGFAVAAAFAAPTDGHWELGLLAGLALVAPRLQAPQGVR
jgi:O-Antigen ligase